MKFHFGYAPPSPLFKPVFYKSERMTTATVLKYNYRLIVNLNYEYIENTNIITYQKNWTKEYFKYPAFVNKMRITVMWDKMKNQRIKKNK